MNVEKSRLKEEKNGIEPEKLKEKEGAAARIEKLKKQHDAVVLAHYYQRAEIQEVADFIGDSLALAQIAAKLPNRVIVMCGVHFMGETVKLLCPDKIVIVPELKAGCSLADSCPAEEFAKFTAKHPDHLVLSYVNTSAAVKALTDIVVTSGNARRIVEQLPADTKIIFGPDHNLGSYINKVTGRNMLLWNGACHVHHRFSAEKIARLKELFPDSPVLVHPECPPEVVDLADCVGSTAVLLKYVQENDAPSFIVVTETGIFHEMQKKAPGKKLIEAPFDIKDVPEDCKDFCNGVCNTCEYMKMNTLDKVVKSLETLSPEIEIDPEIRESAKAPILRMLEMS